MNQEQLDIRDKTGEELIISYNLISQQILDDLKQSENINIEEYLKEKLNVSNE